MPTPVPFRTGPLLARALSVFVLTVGLVGAGSWIPTQSRDEAATISAVTRTWSQLGAMLANVDVVHALYYAAMKVWLDQVGISTVTLRAPSVLACGLAAALVVLLGSLLVSPRAGLLGGLVLAAAPRLTKIATEGRSAAWFTAAAVLLVLVVVLAVRRPSWLWLLPTAAATALLGGLQVYTILLAPVLALYLWLAPGEGRRTWWRAGLQRGGPTVLLGLAVGLVPVVALALRARDQQAQVDWIEAPTLNALSMVATESVSPANPLWAVLAWSLAATGLGWLSRGRQHLGSAAFLLVGWLGFPGLALLVASALWTPLYSPRYLAFCLGGLALLAGTGLASVRRSWLAAPLAVAVALTSVVSYRAQRQVDAWDDWARLMAVVAYQAAPGDVVIDYPLVSALTVSYPDGLLGLPVLNAGRNRLDRHYLWDERRPLADVENRLRGVRRVWYLAPSANDDDERRRVADLARLRQLGFERVSVQRSAGEQTYLLTRTTEETREGDRLLRTPG